MGRDDLVVVANVPIETVLFGSFSDVLENCVAVGDGGFSCPGLEAIAVGVPIAVT